MVLNFEFILIKITKPVRGKGLRAEKRVE